jgi:hypothetical protein
MNYYCGMICVLFVLTMVFVLPNARPKHGVIHLQYTELVDGELITSTVVRLDDGSFCEGVGEWGEDGESVSVIHAGGDTRAILAH